MTSHELARIRAFNPSSYPTFLGIDDRLQNPGTYVPGRIYKVEVSLIGSGTITSQSAGTTELEWTQQPSNQTLSSEMTFNYSYETYQQVTNTFWKRSDDGGETWSLTSEEDIRFSSSSEQDGKTQVNGSLTITNPGTYVPGRIYRVEVTVLGIGIRTSQNAGVV